MAGFVPPIIMAAADGSESLEMNRHRKPDKACGVLCWYDGMNATNLNL
jgi:hypothetical protein